MPEKERRLITPLNMLMTERPMDGSGSDGWQCMKNDDKKMTRIDDD